MLYYLHIPKSAGTSIRHLFQNVYRERLVEVYGPEADYAACKPDSVLFGHFGFSLHKCLNDGKPSYMTLLRNPIDRVISWYKHQARDPGSPFYRLIAEQRLNLARIIEQGLAPEVNNHSVRMICVDYLNPRRQRLRDACSALFLGRKFYQFDAARHLRTALDRIRQFFCFVGITDRLDLFRRFLARRNNLDPASIVIPKDNVAHNHVEIDSQTLRLVREANQLDMKLYRIAAANC